MTLLISVRLSEFVDHIQKQTVIWGQVTFVIFSTLSSMCEIDYSYLPNGRSLLTRTHEMESVYHVWLRTRIISAYVPSCESKVIVDVVKNFFRLLKENVGKAKNGLKTSCIIVEYSHIIGTQYIGLLSFHSEICKHICTVCMEEVKYVPSDM